MTIGTEATTKMITLKELKRAVDPMMGMPPIPKRYDVSPDFYDWLVSHRVEPAMAVDYMMGVTIDVHLDWTGIRAEPVYE